MLRPVGSQHRSRALRTLWHHACRAVRLSSSLRLPALLLLLLGRRYQRLPRPVISPWGPFRWAQARGTFFDRVEASGVVCLYAPLSMLLSVPSRPGPHDNKRRPCAKMVIWYPLSLFISHSHAYFSARGPCEIRSHVMRHAAQSHPRSARKGEASPSRVRLRRPAVRVACVTR